MVRIRNSNLTDALMCVFLIVVLAFRDYSTAVNALSFVLLAWMLAHIVSSGKLKREIANFAVYKSLFVVLSMLSSLWAPNTEIAHLCSSMLQRLMICLCVLLYINSEDNLRKTIRFLIAGAAVLCLRMLVVVPTNVWGTSRVGVYLAHDPSNSYGNTGITYVLGVVSAIMIADRRALFCPKRLQPVLIVVYILFSLMSGSKKQVFILLIAFFFVTIYYANNPLVRARNLLLFIVAFFVVRYLLYNVPILYNAIGYRMESFLSFWGESGSANMKDLSTISRISFLQDASMVFLSHPFLGVGIDSFKFYNTYQFTWAECNYLELLADLGGIGFILYYIPHMRIVIHLRNYGKGKDPVWIIMVTLFAVLAFIDLTMVTYNVVSLQIYLAIVYGYCMICTGDKKGTTENG